MSIHREYFEYFEKYQKKYGNRTIVLMQVGSFHEAYATHKRGYDLNRLSEILNITCTRKDKSKLTIDDSNPMMLGFPTFTLNKFIKILIENSFTVVVIDQITPPPDPKRAITQICSPSTYIEESYNPDANYLVSLYIEEEKQRDDTQLFAVGMSCIDLSKGDNMIHEVYSKKEDDKLAFDEAIQFINKFSPKEIIINRKNNNSTIKMTKDELLAYLELDNRNVHYKENEISKDFYNLSFKNEFLKKVFNNTGILSPIEYLDLEKMEYGLMSYILLLDFAYQHNEKIINNIFKPEIYNENKHLTLGNNAVFQLNIIENTQLDTYNNRIKSLFDVVNKTSTAMGRRILRERLLAPYVNEDKIIDCHDKIQKLIEFKMSDELNNYLGEILDIERMNRRLFMKMMHPHQFAGFYESLQSINLIISLLEKDKKMLNFLPDKKTLMTFRTLIDDIDDNVLIDEMKKFNLNEITSNFFIKGIATHLDDIQDKINDSTNFLNNLSNVLSSYIKDKKKSVNDDKSKISIKNNDRDGYYLLTTAIRASILKKEILELKTLKVGKMEINVKDLEFNSISGKNGSSIKITTPEIYKSSSLLVILKEKMMNEVKSEYLKFLDYIKNEYSSVLIKINDFITNLDYLNSGAKVAKMYNYCKPVVIKNHSNGYFKATKLRHPIIERVNEDKEFIPNDFSLGKPNIKTDDYLNGMLIYGLNACGKSTSMKSIGLAVVLAQCGYYVPADEFILAPYSSLYARVSGNDNIFKGLSSFALEMTELRSILRRASSKTLVIGDEICRGTEHISGISIVASTINMIAHKNCSFIFATHIHELPDIEEVKMLKHVKPFHLKVLYDKDNDKLIFERKLEEGTGESIYGITVAKFIIQDNEFIRMAQKIKNDLIQVPNNIILPKKSNYNSNVYVNECQICHKKISTNPLGTGLEAHHINFQKNCKNGFVIDKKHIKQHSSANLAVICEKCHHDVHNGSLIIDGYKDTSNGKELKFSYI
jgi:DNA mismatch repair protein MutS